MKKVFKPWCHVFGVFEQTGLVRNIDKIEMFACSEVSFVPSR